MGLFSGGLGGLIGSIGGFALGGPTGAAIGGSIGGGLDTNQANAKQAELNRDFQADMSGTAYQRAVADMKAAGLNPLLAYGQGGASTPGGSTATMENVMSPAINSAMVSQRLHADIKNLEATNSQILSTTDLNKKLTTKAVADAASSATAAQLNSTLNAKAAFDKVAASHNAVTAAANSRLAATAAAAAEAELPAQKLKSQINSGTTAKVTGYIEKVLEPFTQLLHGGSSAYRAYTSGQQ